MFESSYRLLCGGKVISEVLGKLGPDFAVRQLEIFRDHLQRALRDPSGFCFNGAGKPMNAEEYLAFHSRKLGLPIVDDFEVVPPGKAYPLAPNHKNIT